MSEPDAARTLLDRTKIVEGALVLVRNEGVGALTMRRLAREIGYSAASLYMHFRGKEEVLRAVAAGALAELAARVTPLRTAPDPGAALREAAGHVLGAAAASPALDRLAFDETPGAPFDSDEDAERALLYDALGTLIARVAEEGRLAASLEPAQATGHAWAQLRGLARLLRGDGVEPPAARATAAVGADALAEEWARHWLRNDRP